MRPRGKVSANKNLPPAAGSAGVVATEGQENAAPMPSGKGALGTKALQPRTLSNPVFTPEPKKHNSGSDNLSAAESQYSDNLSEAESQNVSAANRDSGSEDFFE